MSASHTVASYECVGYFTNELVTRGFVYTRGDFEKMSITHSGLLSDWHETVQTEFFIDAVILRVPGELGFLCVYFNDSLNDLSSGEVRIEPDKLDAFIARVVMTKERPICDCVSQTTWRE